MISNGKELSHLHVSRGSDEPSWPWPNLSRAININLENRAPIGMGLYQNACLAIPNLSFVDADKGKHGKELRRHFRTKYQFIVMFEELEENTAQDQL